MLGGYCSRLLSTLLDRFCFKAGTYWPSQTRQCWRSFCILRHGEVCSDLWAVGCVLALGLRRVPSCPWRIPSCLSTFPIVLGLSAVCLCRNDHPLRWAGVGVIVVGVSLLART